MKLASKVVAQARDWLGCEESDGSHKKIIDIYNGHRPLARSYKVKCIANGDGMNDAWCATFVSAVAIACGCTDIIPTECGCWQMMELFKDMVRWVESDSYIPRPGDIIFYDWEDNGNGDNNGAPDHVGIVEKVTGNTITVIEGNYSDSVKRRSIAVNGKNIRGYGVPDYDKETEEVKTEVKTDVKTEVKIPQLAKGNKGDSVKALQILLIGLGHSCGEDGADGDFGPNTDKAVRAFQKTNGLEVDGIVGPATWSKLLGVIV